MADPSISGASENDLIKHLVSYGVNGEEAKAALAADASSFQAVMETLLANVFRVPSTWLQPFYSYPPDLESPEVFDESASDWNFYKVVKDNLEKIGVSGFRMKDLHDPSSKQVKRHLLEIINFARFCEWQEGKANAMEDEIMAIAEQNEELDSGLVQLRREFEVACGDHDDREAQLLELEEIHNDEKSKLTSLTREYESLLAETTRAQEAADDAQQQVLSMEEKRQGTLQALDDLRGNLCEDHDQVLAELNKEKELTKEYQEESAADSTEASFYSKWSSDIKQACIRTMRMLDETLAAQDAEKDAAQELADVEEAVGTFEASIAAVQAGRAAQVQDQQANAEDLKQEQARLQEEDAHVAAQVTCHNKQRAHAAARTEMLQAEVAEAHAQAAASARQLEEISLARQQRQALCLGQYDAAPAAVSSFILRVLGLMQSEVQRSMRKFAEHGGPESDQLARLQDRVASLKSIARSLNSTKAQELVDGA